MTTVTISRATRRRGIAFAILLGLSFVMMAFSSNPTVLDLQRGLSFAFRPIESALDDAAKAVSSVIGAIGDIDHIRIENAQLREENERLKAENARAAELKREVDQLTALLQLQNGVDFNTVAAQVIAREPLEFRRVVTLDKGTDAGIVVGDVVVTQGNALAGRIIEVGPNWSTVLLITDTSSTVIGLLPSSRGGGATGEVIGQLSSPLTMEKIDSTEKVDLGQEVVTAGIELKGGVRSPFPKGLVIGQIIDVKRDANAVVQTGYILPTADLEHLEYALVITNYHGGLVQPGNSAPPCAPEPSTGTLPNNEQTCVEPSTAP
jgi:rod shape-determining protein MreC